MKKVKKGHKKKSGRRHNGSGHELGDESSSWVDELVFRPHLFDGRTDEDSGIGETGPSVSVLSWNVLAQAYCSPRSHHHLPVSYQKVVFNPERRKQLLLRTLKRFVLVNRINPGKEKDDAVDQCFETDESSTSSFPVDVLCLQEVDIPEIALFLHDAGYTCIETPGGLDLRHSTRKNGSSSPSRNDMETRGELDRRDTNDTSDSLTSNGRVSSNAGASNKTQPKNRPTRVGPRRDNIGIYVRTHPSLSPPTAAPQSPPPTWEVLTHKVLFLDDLATLSTGSAVPSSERLGDESGAAAEKPSDEQNQPSLSNRTAETSMPMQNNLQGLQQSFLRRNVALMVRIRHVATNETMLIVNCHLYWHPAYDYVKVSM
jgi:hypothetical protein